MSAMMGQGGEIRATIQITRKATGVIETYELVGPVSPEQEEQILEQLNPGATEEPDAIGKEITDRLLHDMGKMFNKRSRD